MKHITTLFESGHERTYPKGQILLYQGEQAQSEMCIKSGYVKVYDITSQGGEKLMLLLGPGDIFPLVWRFRGSETLHYFYESYTDTTVSVLGHDDVLKIIKEDHSAAIAALTYFVNETQTLMSRIDCIEATSAQHKVAQVLLYLAQSLGVPESKGHDRVHVPVTITHQSVANMAGIVRETATLQLKELSDAGTVSTNEDGHFIIEVSLLESLLQQT